MNAVRSEAARSTLNIWEKIILLSGDEPSQGRYQARVEHLINGGIIITQPELLSGETLLREQAPVIVQFIRQDAVYEFASSIKRMMVEGSPRIVLTPARSVRRVQRRLFVRVQVRKAVDYLPLTSDISSSSSWHASNLVDISAGGLLLESDGELLPQALVAVRSPFFAELELPDRLIARVQRTDRQQKRSLAGLQFLLQDELLPLISAELQAQVLQQAVPLDRQLQNRVVSRVFQLQVKLRQKGLL